MRQLATDNIAPAADEPAYFQGGFGWMGVGLAVTGAVSYAIGRSDRALNGLTFLALAVWGATTGSDLTTWGSFTTFRSSAVRASRW